MMVALVRPPLAVAEVVVQVKQAILMVFVRVVTALRHLLLERLSSMLVVAVAVLNLRLLEHWLPVAMVEAVLEIVETVLLLQQEL